MTLTGADTTATRPFVVAVCTNRLDELRKRLAHNIDQLVDEEFLVVIDLPESPEVKELVTEIDELGGTALIMGIAGGLSAARNAVLETRSRQWVLFIDDDVLLTRRALDAVRAEFHAGAQVVGTRLVPPPAWPRPPWYLTKGQWHLIGWHADGVPFRTWGGCMGLDTAFLTRHDLRFDERLGRNGTQLMSGEETTLIRTSQQLGARVHLSRHDGVVHEINPDRLRLRYLLLRTYWQGRTEVRRGDVVGGLKKEWRRYRGNGSSLRRSLLAVFYSAVLVAGMLSETVSGARRGAAKAAPELDVVAATPEEQ